VFPDVEVLDQRGHKVQFYRNLIAGRTIAVNFIFTSCTTICSPVSAGFEAVQRQLSSRMGRDVYLVSISVDPLNDTPAVLREYGAKFKAGNGWTFVTGTRSSIDRILRTFGVPTGGNLSDHSPFVYIGNDAARAWTRIHGLSDPRIIAGALGEAAKRTGASVAPADNPAVVNAFARRHAVDAGRTFVTGKKENVDWVLFKLGLYTQEKAEHTAILWVGNDRTGNWVKLHAMSSPDQVLAAVKRVASD